MIDKDRLETEIVLASQEAIRRATSQLFGMTDKKMQSLLARENHHDALSQIIATAVQCGVTAGLGLANNAVSESLDKEKS